MMQKKKSGVAKRAWNILRLALLWARKGGVFKNRLILDFLKSNFIGQSSTSQRAAIYYGEREFSLDDTPIIHLKMHRPSSLCFRLPCIPCINPQVDFDFNFDFNDDIVSRYKYDGGRGSFSNGRDDDEDDDGDGNFEVCEVDQISSCEEEGIDVKAEKFIAKFYGQMKMQRQVSYLQNNEMLNRGTS
ncbi:hypothetical protein Vadar_014914 [Vaccinium darrowii]|uniref:Uncharacterized protein n=1 Tax=Vaccinium darrowii TaxID=229202 RepID=A0ACB7ZBR0_9ERIC|nr:hypothetical protein Vadar_014914 [Vaccinium darrowii]